MDTRCPRRRRRGFTLMEVMVVLTLMSILVTFVMPTFQRALEQSRADIAAANLRSIWVAQRVYWLDNRSIGYAPDLTTLQGIDLIDASLLVQGFPYSYAVTQADTQAFVVSATRVGSTKWQGAFTIDQTGTVNGSITAAGEAAVLPAPQ